MKGHSVSTVFLYNPRLKPVNPNPSDDDFTLCKILYYHPPTTPTYEKQSHVGLAEGLVMFTKQFSEQPLEFIKTERFTHVILECEPDIWLYLVIQHPESAGFMKIQDFMLSDSMLRRLCTNFHRDFFLFHGALTSYHYPEDYLRLQTILADYVNLFCLEFDKALELFEGLHYCPLDRKVFLHIQLFINQLKTQHPEVKHALITYEGHLVSTDLPHAATLAFYQYFCPQRDWRRLQRCRRDPDLDSCAYARTLPYPRRGYLYGIQTEQWMPIVQLPQLQEKHRLVVWVEESLQYILLLEPYDYTFGLLEALGEELKSQSIQIVSLIGPQYARTQTIEDNFRFVYFNSMNFAIRKSSKLQSDDQLQTLLVQITNLLNQPSTYADGLVRCVVRDSNYFVFGIKSLESREIYVVQPAANTLIHKFEEEAQTCIAQYFSNIFLGF